ncbi:MAG: hypothetical protein AAFR75_02880 [Pseudomonadota bacterium]
MIDRKKRTPEEERAFQLRVAETARDTIDFETDREAEQRADPFDPADWNRALNAYSEGMAMARYSKGEVSLDERNGVRAFVDECFEKRYGISTEAYAEQRKHRSNSSLVEDGVSERFQSIAAKQASQVQNTADIER